MFQFDRSILNMFFKLFFIFIQFILALLTFGDMNQAPHTVPISVPKPSRKRLFGEEGGEWRMITH
jgi:hypothetical protein